MAEKKKASVPSPMSHGLGNGTKKAFDRLSDEELVAMARQKDTWAFEQLVRRYQQKAYAIAVQMGNGDVEEAKDITQQAFLNAFKSIHTFKGNASFYTWFYRILMNTCLDARRRHHRWRQLFSFRFSKGLDGKDAQGTSFEDVADPNHRAVPDTTFESQELDRTLKTTLESLPEKQRCAFQLKVFQGLSITEISQIMGLRPGTIKSHLFRATKSLRHALTAWEKPKGRES